MPNESSKIQAGFGIGVEHRAAPIDYKALFEKAPGLYLVLSPALIIVAVSDAYASATMAARETIVGRPLFDLFPDDPNDPSADSARNLHASLMRVLEFKQADPMPIQRYDVRLHDWRGGGFEERYWSPLNVPIFDAAGEILWIMHSVEDVTELATQQKGSGLQRLTRDQQAVIDRLRDVNRSLDSEVRERRAAEGELSRARQFLNKVIENIPGMVYAKDAENLSFVLLNHGGEQLLGYDRREMIGKTDYDFLPKETADAHAARDREILASRKLHVTPEEIITNRTGKVRYLETKKMPIFGRNGKPEFLLALSEDITDRRTLELQLRQAQKLEAIGRLTGGMAHDFNNLLGVVIANIDLLIEELGGDTAVSGLARDALDGALRGHALIERMLAFGRQQPLQPTVLNIGEVLAGLVGLLRRTLREDVELIVTGAENVPAVMVDKSQLENAVVNLAINAVHAMPDGGSLILETTIAYLDSDYAAQHPEVTPGAYALLSVTDSGVGMTAEIVDRAFDPFFTTKPVGVGSGMGLSMVYGFVKQSGGHIKIYSEIGHGTTIRLYLPVANQSVSPSLVVVETPAPGRHSGTILLVEDEPALRRSAARILLSLGYTVYEAGSAPQALAFLRTGQPVDLLFSDVVMPGGMTGVELAGIAASEWPGLKILLTSGYSEILVRASDDRLESVQMIGKPYRKIELAAKLDELFDNG